MAFTEEFSKKGNIRKSVRAIYANLHYGSKVVRKLGIYAERYFDSIKEIESLKEEIKTLQRTVRDNPRIETLSRTLEIRDRQIAELEKQNRLLTHARDED